MLATFSHETRADAAVLVICGEIDISNVSDFGRAIEAAAKDCSQNLVLDLTSVTYLDSTGLREVLRAQRLADASDRRLCVIAPEASVARRILSRTGLIRPLLIADSIDDVVREQEPT
jgi:anti-sigma B factor antagonist